MLTYHRSYPLRKAEAGVEMEAREGYCLLDYSLGLSQPAFCCNSGPPAQGWHQCLPNGVYSPTSIIKKMHYRHICGHFLNWGSFSQITLGVWGRQNVHQDMCLLHRIHWALSLGIYGVQWYSDFLGGRKSIYTSTCLAVSFNFITTLCGRYIVISMFLDQGKHKAYM